MIEFLCWFSVGCLAYASVTPCSPGCWHAWWATGPWRLVCEYPDTHNWATLAAAACKNDNGLSLIIGHFKD